MKIIEVNNSALAGKPVIRRYLPVWLTMQLVAFIASAQSFVHPGLLHRRADLERMKTLVAKQVDPVYQGYLKFIQDPASGFSYTMRGPMEMVGRNPTVGQNEYDNDANAAHQNAIMWVITGDRRYADKSIAIVDAWCATLKNITGRDAILMAGLGPFKMLNAAEILRYTNTGWKDSSIQAAEKHFRKVIYPVIADFATFANGNWDAAAMKTMMAIGVFCNDRQIFNRALDYYVNGSGNGNIFHYIINEEGQVQESGRDQAHTQLGIGMLAEACAIAWNQGLDLYGYANNRLLKAFEYVAKFNLGEDVPFMEWLDRTGKYHHTKISQDQRGNLRAVYEQVYAHYVVQCGLQAPYVARAVEKVRPEGPGRPSADHPGYGTLYFAGAQRFDPQSIPLVAPAGIVIADSAQTRRISWVAPIAARSYTIAGSVKKNGKYKIVAKAITGNEIILHDIKAGAANYYQITANGKAGKRMAIAEPSIP